MPKVRLKSRKLGARSTRAAPATVPQWLWLDSTGNEHPFSSEADVDVEKAYQLYLSDKDEYKFWDHAFQSGKYTYLVDFNDMTQTNYLTQKERHVVRKLVPVPRMTSKEAAAALALSILRGELATASASLQETKLKMDQLRQERDDCKNASKRDARKAEASELAAKKASELAVKKARKEARLVVEFWKGPAKPLSYIEVSEDMKTQVCKTFQACSHQMARHMGQPSICRPFQSLTVLSVRSVHNPALWERYTATLRAMRGVLATLGITPGIINPAFSALDEYFSGAELDRSLNEMFLTHGCSEETANAILKSGFDTRFSRPTDLYGEGIYFAKEMCKAHQYAAPSSSGVCHMLVARVVLGDPYHVTDRYVGRMPPLRDEGNNDSGRYDSNVADPRVSKIKQWHWEFVVFDGHQAYPEMIVTYQVP